MPSVFLSIQILINTKAKVFHIKYSMMNHVWTTIILLSLISTLVTGRGEAALEALSGGAGEAVTLSISLLGGYMLWMGIMNVASEAGLIESLAKLVEKPLRRLFKNPAGAIAPITLNLAANFFGMGSAATPFGLSAMQQLQNSAKRHGKDLAVATDDMVMFIAMNSSAIELLPTGVLAMRAAHNSMDVYCVVVPTFIASILAFTSAVLLCYLFSSKNRTKKGG